MQPDSMDSSMDMRHASCSLLSTLSAPLRPLLYEGFLQSAGVPLAVIEHVRDANGMPAKRIIQHRLILSAAVGDSPARQKWSMWLSHHAYLACGYCQFCGTRGGNAEQSEKGGMYFFGYAEPAPQKVGLNAGDSLMFNAPEVQLTNG